MEVDKPFQFYELLSQMEKNCEGCKMTTKSWGWCAHNPVGKNFEYYTINEDGKPTGNIYIGGNL